MENQQHITPDKKLIDFDTSGDIALQSEQTLRRLVGILGMLLPLLIYLFLQVTDDFNPVLPSISHYYFTRSSAIFEIIVSSLAIFLIIYKGKKLIDFMLSTTAGIAALLLLLCPTTNLRGLFNGKYDAVAVTYFKQSDFRPVFHYICASIFLLSLAIMALFLFTKSDKEKGQRTKQKVSRNRIYRVCGVVMLAALITAFLGYIHVIPENIYDANHLTFWMEVVAVESFGIAWMVKGGVVFKDK